MVGAFTVNAQESVWGMTTFGGASDYGVIYKTDLNGQNQEIVYEWSNNNSGFNSQRPVLGLVDGKDGYLYGSTIAGGTSNNGVLFRINKLTNAYEELADLSSFNMIKIGIAVDGTNGIIYGVAPFGQATRYGSVFQYDINSGDLTNLFTWTTDAEGLNSVGNPVLHNGLLLGVKSGGGQSSDGVLYAYNVADDSYNVLHHFNTNAGGAIPFFEFEIINNSVIGTTHEGGAYGFGTIYSYNLSNNTFEILHDFNGIDGKGGRSISRVNDQLLIGNTIDGGTNDEGVIFTYGLASGVYTKKIDLSVSVTGSNPETRLVKVSNNTFMGFTSNGTESGNGKHFTYDLSTNNISVNFSFDGANGHYPSYNTLVKASNDYIHIVSQPESITICEGREFELTVEATPEELSYEWFQNEIAIPNSNSETLTIISAELEHAGSYYCKVINGEEELISESATVEITPSIRVDIEEEVCNPFDVTTETLTYNAYNGCDSIVTVYKSYIPVNADFQLESDEATVTFENTSENATTYLWSFGDGTTSSEANPVHEYPGTGFYLVLLVSMRDGCFPDFKIRFVFVFNGFRTTAYTAPNMNMAEKIKAYPNPSSGPISLTSDKVFSSNSQFELTVMDIYGKVVHNEMMSSIHHSFDLSHLTPATYMVNVMADGKSFEQKIVIAH